MQGAATRTTISKRGVIVILLWSKISLSLSIGLGELRCLAKGQRVIKTATKLARGCFSRHLRRQEMPSMINFVPLTENGCHLDN